MHAARAMVEEQPLSATGRSVELLLLLLLLEKGRWFLTCNSNCSRAGPSATERKFASARRSCLSCRRWLYRSGKASSYTARDAVIPAWQLSADQRQAAEHC